MENDITFHLPTTLHYSSWKGTHLERHQTQNADGNWQLSCKV